jgi:hypothetical protein
MFLLPTPLKLYTFETESILIYRIFIALGQIWAFKTLLFGNGHLYSNFFLNVFTAHASNDFLSRLILVHNRHVQSFGQGPRTHNR